MRILLLRLEVAVTVLYLFTPVTIAIAILFAATLDTVRRARRVSNAAVIFCSLNVTWSSKYAGEEDGESHRA